MAAPEDTLLSVNQKTFVLRALIDGLRTDGRFFHESRKAKLQLRRYEDQTNAHVELGKTRVHAVISATLGKPFGDRGNEGTLAFAVNMGPLAGPQYEVSRSTPLTTELARMLERQIKDSRAIDLEALCITPGVHVWQLRCDVHVSCDDGNLADACSLGAIVAFMHFRRPDTTVHEDGSVETHSFSAKPPLPLSLHHIPVSVTLGLFGNPEARLRALDFTVASTAAASASSGGSGASAPSSSSGAGADDDEEGGGGLGSASSELAVMDPCALEEAVYNGRVTFVMNAHKELCGIHKLGGCPLPPALLLSATRVAGQRAQDLVALVRSAVAAADKEADERDAAKVVAAAVGAAPAGALQVAAEPSAAAAAGAASGGAVAAGGP